MCACAVRCDRTFLIVLELSFDSYLALQEERVMQSSRYMKSSLVAALLLLAASSVAVGSVQAYLTPLRIMDVYVSSSSTPYDRPVTVEILVEHNGTVIPQVMIYYASFINMNVQRGGWRSSPAQLVFYNSPPGHSLFTTDVPSASHPEILPYPTKIVFYVEARDIIGNIVLSCREADRWDFTVEDDKYVIILEDPYPPKINQTSIEATPEEPTSIDEVTITAMISDDVKLGGSGVKEATLHYSLANGRDWKSTPMTLREHEIWEGTIPPQPRDEKVVYYIKATDAAGNSVASDRLSYKVSPSPQELQRQHLIMSAALALAAIVLAVLALVFRRRIIPYIKHRKATATVVLAALVIIGSLLYWFIEKGRWLWPTFILIIMAELWSLTNPKIRSVLVGSCRSALEYLTRVFNENPPTVLIATCYALGLATAAGIFLLVVFRAYTLTAAYYMANLFAEYIFYLLVAGVLGQLLLSAYKTHAEAKEKDQESNDQA